jgi:hypothetical protein
VRAYERSAICCQNSSTRKQERLKKKKEDKNAAEAHTRVALNTYLKFQKCRSARTHSRRRASQKEKKKCATVFVLL